MKPEQLAKAIYKLRPNSEFTFTDVNYSTIKWIVLEGEAPTQKEVEKAVAELETQEMAEAQAKAEAKAALLERLGISEEEAKLLLG